MIDLDAVRRSVAEANPLLSTDPISPTQAQEIVSSIERRLQVGSWGVTDTPHRTEPAMDREIRRSRWTPAIVAAAASLAVLATFAVPTLVGYWLRSEGETPIDPPTTTVTPTTAAATTTTTEPPSTTTTVPPVGLPITWERVPHDPMFEDAAFSRAATDGKRVVVVGSGGFVDGFPTKGVVWASDDGATWQRIDDPSFALPADADQHPSWMAGIGSVAYANGLFVASGNIANDGAVWVSEDGIAWTRVDAPSLGGDGLEQISGLAAGAPGWVAVGQDDLNAAVWFSPDGSSWEAVDDPDLRADGDIVSAMLFDVVEGGPGYVAVGWIQVKDDANSSITEAENRAAVWVSVDGRDWTLTDLGQLEDEFIIASVAVDPIDGSLIGFGWNGLWRSADGVSWSLSDPRGSEWTSLPPPGVSIAWFGDGAVAAGQDLALALWTSADHGMTWVLHDRQDPVFEGHNPMVSHVIRFDDRVIAFGKTGEYLSEVAAVWIGQ